MWHLCNDAAFQIKIDGIAVTYIDMCIIKIVLNWYCACLCVLVTAITLCLSQTYALTYDSVDCDENY
jgi:hypothetical protein